MDQDPAQPPRTVLGPAAEQANQVAVVVLAVGLVAGLIWLVMVSVETNFGMYRAMAGLTVLFAVAGLLAGFTASTYDRVISGVRWVANLGAVIESTLAFLSTGYAGAEPGASPEVSVLLSLAVGGLSFVPRIAVLVAAAGMLAGSLVVFQLARVDLLLGISVVVSALWMVGAAALIGNGLAEVMGRGGS